MLWGDPQRPSLPPIDPTRTVSVMPPTTATATTRTQERDAATATLARQTRRRRVDIAQVEAMAGLAPGSIAGPLDAGRPLPKATLWAWSAALGKIIAGQSGSSREG